MLQKTNKNNFPVTSSTRLYSIRLAKRQIIAAVIFTTLYKLIMAGVRRDHVFKRPDRVSLIYFKQVKGLAIQRDQYDCYSECLCSIHLQNKTAKIHFIVNFLYKATSKISRVQNKVVEGTLLLLCLTEEISFLTRTLI